MPSDLLIEIFLRLAVEDIARCRCVSKLWSSLLRRPDFTEQFLRMSSSRPLLLFTLVHNGRRFFYSAPQTLNPDHKYVSTIVPYYHMNFPKGLGSCQEMCVPVHGLICTKARKPMICNPSTGEYIALPKLSTKKAEMSVHFGYDAFNKVFKVLCVLSKDYDYACRVLTVRTGEVAWRKIECTKPHQPLHSEICIDGVLYYLAKCMGDETADHPYMVVCFDIRFEKFKFLAVETKYLCSALINFKGKLGVLWPGSVSKSPKIIELRVLEDADKLEWSKTVYMLPSYWETIATNTFLYTVGMTSAGEVVISTLRTRDPFYIFYYNIVKNTVVRVEIKFGIIENLDIAMEAYFSKILTFIDHVENLELID